MIYMIKKYVDDVNLYCEAMKLGTRYREGELVWRRRWQTEDKIAKLVRALKKTQLNSIKLD